MGLRDDIRNYIEHTPFVDTHEHIWEESFRVRALEMGGESPIPAPDIGMLFSHYANSDLRVAGMSAEELKHVASATRSPKAKWAILDPYYRRMRNTGYAMNVRESVRLLFGHDDLTAQNVEEISEKFRAAIKPGYYNVVLRDFANVEYCHVNSLEGDIFCETAQPDLLAQDLSFVALTTTGRLELADRAGITLKTLKDWHGVIDWAFATYGLRAIAVKSQIAYGRGLDFAKVSAPEVAPIFEERLAKGEEGLSAADTKALQDHLFHYCVEKAVEYELPVKLHTGYYAGHNSMPLSRLSKNPAEMCELCRMHPDAKFIFMHITYPYQDAAIATAKQWSNAYIDMCWAAIINPVASVRFVKEFLLAAPASKLFTFGGDYMPVELVPGHAAIARRVLTQAVSELVEEGWVPEAHVEALIDRIMRGNAHEMYDLERTLEHWKKTG
ncbi:MAG: amidohydrolase family protein [Candidatus Hydrogenedentota bacterium]